MKKFISLIFSLLLGIAQLWSQGCGLGLTWVEDILSPVACNNTLTAHEDLLGRKYLYVANKEQGLTIYDVSGSAALVKQVPVSSLGSLQVMNLSQTGNYLYLALGNHFGIPAAKQTGGLAIVDVTKPDSAFVTDYWVDTTSSQGSGMAIADGNFAYLAVMDRGIAVIDASDKSNLAYVTHFVPDVTFPDPTPTLAHVNARGMQIRDNVMYLCYDAGGLRVINLTNPAAPVETGRYSAPAMDAIMARAYNNVVVDGSLAYVAVDWCGMEILDISDTTNITQVGWWNPWNCTAPTSNWFNFPGYTNEIAMDTLCKRVFLSTGRNDLMVVDVSNPAAPDSCDSWGNHTDSLATWGVSITPQRVYLGYFCTLGIPFKGDSAFVRILDIGNACPTSAADARTPTLSVYPNPTTGSVTLPADAAKPGQWVTLSVTDALGREVHSHSLRWEAHEMELQLPDAPGVYFVSLQSAGSRSTAKVIRQ
jgi:hypothetical protein